MSTGLEDGWRHANDAMNLTFGAALGGYLGVSLTANMEATKAGPLAILLALLVTFVLSVTSIGRHFHRGQILMSLAVMALAGITVFCIGKQSGSAGVSPIAAVTICTVWLSVAFVEILTSIPAIIMRNRS